MKNFLQIKYLVMIVGLMMGGSIYAQSVNDWEWTKIDKLIEKRTLDVAFEQTDVLLNRAIAAKQSKEVLVGVMMKSKISALFQENCGDSIGSWLVEVKPYLDAQHLAIWHVMYANYYRWYAKRVRTGVSNDKSEQFLNWTRELRYGEMMAHIDTALRSAELLQSANTKDYKRILVDNSGAAMKGITITPTLLDVALMDGFEISKEYEERVSLLMYDNLKSLVLPIGVFSQVDVDKSFAELKPLHYIQQLEIRHQHDVPNRQIRLFVERLKYMSELKMKDSIMEYGLKRGIEVYRMLENNDDITMLYYILAEGYMEKKDYVKAMESCNVALEISKRNEGAVKCRELKKLIEQEHINLTTQREGLADRSHFVAMKTRNMKRVYFRLYDVSSVDIAERGDYEALKKKDAKRVREWEVEVKDKGDYQEVVSAVVVPAMPCGEYILYASSDARFDVKKVAKIHVINTNMAIEQRVDDGLCGMVRSRIDGSALSGKKVALRHDGEICATAITDLNGFYKFTDISKKSEIRGWNSSLEVYDSNFVWRSKLNVDDRKRPDEERKEMYIFVDRPVYRLGETIEWALVLNRFDGEQERVVLTNMKMKVSLLDANRKVVDTMSVVTDAYGRGTGEFVLPKEGLNGDYLLKVEMEDDLTFSRYKSVTVLAYKQPTFMVSLIDENKVYPLDMESTIEGRVVAYNGAMMNGAVVKYTIERDSWMGFGVEKEIVTTGQTTCDREGKFEFKFVPTQDRKQSEKNVFNVKVSVTDVNGETQTQMMVITSSANPRQLMIISNENDWEWKDLRFSYINLDRAPLKGKINIKIERLKQLDTARMVLWGWTDAMQSSISRDTFEKEFPYYAYDSEKLNPMNWAVEQLMVDTIYQADGGMVNVMKLGHMETGVYRVTLKDSYGTEAVHIVRLTREEALKCLSDNLLWSDVECYSCKVDSQAKVRIGSRYRGVNVLYNIVHNGKVIEKGMFELNDEIKFLMIPITKLHEGGFTVNLSAVYQNMGQQIHHFIKVPYVEKENEIELVTFRDKLQPGVKEHWTLKTSKPHAAMLLTMYDKALTTYRSMSWDMKYWEQYDKDMKLGMISELCRDDGWNEDLSWYSGIDLLEEFEFEKYSFVMGGDDRNGFRRPMYGAVGSARPTAKRTVFEEAYEEGEMVMDSGIEVLSINEVPDVKIRTNLNPVVFFMDDLISDSKGLVSISFEAPELLTRWNVQGFSWTKDMAVGSFVEQVVTQKDLMVMPNVPRFMRQGDKMNFGSKVTNMSGKDESVVVEFWLKNAEDDAMVMHKRKTIEIASGESKSVNFDVVVPDNIYVANYKIVAKGRRCSDGEQGQIPVLSNRQLVTESMAMYINGNEEKSYVFDHLKDNNSSTLQHHGMMLEFASNPMWYAIQALPYMEEHQSPSMMYLMNQLYVNELGGYIVSQNPMIEQMIKSWDEGDEKSKLERNESIKQTILSETPWLNQAQNETEQYGKVAQYLDSNSLNKSIVETKEKLSEGQREDGGWSWIAGDRASSVYVTEYILRQMGSLMGKGVELDSAWNEKLQKALTYCDREEYKYYEKITKDDKRPEISNIYYLYMRSYYPDGEFEGKSKKSYDYFYKNALKNYKEYEDLYTQGQLALIFFRNGDKKEAIEIAKALKNMALYSDEMGMYWRDNVGGYWWYKRPIETQAMLIKVFDEVLNDMESVGKMQQWLLKQKQTTSWGNDVATANAIEALMCGDGAKQLSVVEPVEIKVAGKKIDVKSQRGTGYITKMWDNEQVNGKMAQVDLKKATKGCAWGAMYWQYFEDLDKIEYSEMGIKMDKRYYRVELNEEVTEIKGDVNLQVGDRVRVRILIDCDRNLEYLQLKDQRASAFEPVNSESGWRWNWKDGLSYYVDMQDACANFYINRLEKGKYVLEYDMWVTNSGDFSCGIASMQCMYAPEFRCNTKGVRLNID